MSWFNLTCCIIEKLKRIQINEKQIKVDECFAVTPVFLINREGEHFIASGISNGELFQTCYFKVISVNELRKCAVLELLVPCCKKTLCANKVLYRSDSRILIDISFFSGIGEVKIPAG
ncbi:CotZ-related putative spore coat protein [Bacillus subtilis]